MGKPDEHTKDIIGSARLTRFLARRAMFIAIAVSPVAFYGAILGSIRLWSDLRSAGWPSTVGTIIDVKYHDDDEHDPSASIRYCYHLKGAVYESQWVSMHSPSPWGGARAFVEAHPKRSEVTVYYDPDNPTIGVLNPGADVASYAFALFPLGFSFLCLIIIGHGIYTRYLLRLVRRGDDDAIRELIKGKKELPGCMEGTLLAADLPSPEVFLLLVPFVDKNTLEMLTVYTEHKGTPRMHERLKAALADKQDDSPALLKAWEKIRDNPKASRKLVLRIGAVTAVIIVGWSVVACAWNYRRITVAQSWPTTTATVVRADVVENSDDPEAAALPVIEYTYEVNGSAYTSRSLTAPGARHLQLRSESEVTHYRRTFGPGGVHRVYYRPASPSDSYLLRPSPNEAWGPQPTWTLVGIACYLLAWLSCVLGKRAPHRKE